MINDKILGNASPCLEKMLKSLWENPKIVAHILMKSNPKEIEYSLSPLFSNNFYENILSQKFVQNNLLYIITLLLKNEIDKFTDMSHPEKFLNTKSVCGYLLYELRNKKDYQIFLKEAIEEVVEKLDKYPYDICFDIEKINDNLENEIKFLTEHKQDREDLILLDEAQLAMLIANERLGRDINKRMYIENMKIIYFKDINIDVGNDLEGQVNKEVLNYFKKNILLKKNSFLQNSNLYFNNTINKQKYKSEVFSFYVNDFYIATKFIETLLKNLKEKINIIPYSARIISKIISILISKKNSEISIVQRNAFICRFFFCMLFWPQFDNPDMGYLIDNFIISNRIWKNLLEIENIFVNFILGNLYEEEKNYHLCPFNKFFIKQMDTLVSFIDELIEINLPEFIEKTLEDDNTYKYDYKKLNEKDGLVHLSICFSTKDIEDIIINVMKNKNNILIKENEKFDMHLGKLIESKKYEIIRGIQEEEKNSNKIYFFLISESIFLNDKFKKLFAMKKNMNYFTIKELDQEAEENNIKNLIIKAKNCLSGLLFNFITLTTENFPKYNCNNFNIILNELLALSKIPNYTIDDTIPTMWYVNSLIEILPKLPKEMTNNNCQKMFQELKNEINNSIKELDFESLTLINGRLNFTKRIESSIENSINLIREMKIYQKALSIINDYKNFKIQISFIFDEKNPLFNFTTTLNMSEFSFMVDEGSFMPIEPKEANSISEFIQIFPNLNECNISNKIDILEFEEKLNVPEKIFRYFEIINKYLSENNQFSKEESEKIGDKIYDHIMENLYDKIFPNQPGENELKNYQNTLLYSWVEPKHLLKEKSCNIYNSFLPDVFKYIKLFMREKSPRKKIQALSYLDNVIEQVIKFNGGKGLLGVEDFLPILVFSYIKSQPFGIYSHIKFTQLYKQKSDNGKADLYLAKLESAYKFVDKISYNELYNIKREEFDKIIDEQKILNREKSN